MANIAAITICIILILAGIFQALLASGKPWGEWAYGGQNAGVLPKELRVSSVFAIFIYCPNLSLLRPSTGNQLIVLDLGKRGN